MYLFEASVEDDRVKRFLDAGFVGLQLDLLERRLQRFGGLRRVFELFFGGSRHQTHQTCLLQLIHRSLDLLQHYPVGDELLVDCPEQFPRALDYFARVAVVFFLEVAHALLEAFLPESSDQRVD